VQQYEQRLNTLTARLDTLAQQNADITKKNGGTPATKG
jgi:hypothetical protein